MRYRVAALVLGLGGCSNAPSSSPFVVDAGPKDATSDLVTYDALDDGGIPLGGPCLEDRQCNDGIDCTFDTCNRAFSRCQNVPDDARCQNGIFCDGPEICDKALGCRRGQVTTCSDDNGCTIDRCVEETKTCSHVLRDADGDGNPDGHCVAGGDCDDNDPTVFAGHPEVCANHKDDNCDGQIDESPCQTPSHDTCLDPLLIVDSGVYELDTTAATYDYGGTCAPTDPATRRDVVAALQITGDARDVDVVVEAPGGLVALAIAGQCNQPTTELACATGMPGPLGNALARVRMRDIGPGTFPLYVWTDRDEKVLLHVVEGPPTTPPTNETCASALPIVPSVPVTASLTGTSHDIASRCMIKSGDLVYALTLSAPGDVSAFATSLDGYGVPVVSLRGASCAAIESEIACGTGTEAKAFARALPAGTYYIGVGASAPTDARVEVTVTPPSTPPPDERCDGAPMITPNRTWSISLADHTDDIEFACSDASAIDAAYDIELGEASDVLLDMRVSAGDIGTVALARAACDSALACAKQSFSPVRATMRNVPAGSYRAVVESRVGSPVQLTAFVRPAVPTTLVPFADTCATAPLIDERGGFFQGNTANAQADYSAGCDGAGNGPGGAPDQMLKLVLTTQRRVIFDMQGSTYATLLDIRKGDTCPGTEVQGGCSAGYVALRSFLDMTLDAGTYWVQVDGYGTDQGTWFLDVRVVDP